MKTTKRKSTKREKLDASFKLPQTPDRAQVDEDSVRKLALRTASSPAAEVPGPAASKRRREESGVRLTAYVPSVMRKAIRVLCAKEDRSVSDATTEAFSDWLAKKAAEAAETPQEATDG